MRSHSNSSTDSDSENEPKRTSIPRNHAQYHDERTGTTIVTNTTLSVTRLFGRITPRSSFLHHSFHSRSIYGNDRNAQTHCI